jgi:hypothetical protein
MMIAAFDVRCREGIGGGRAPLRIYACASPILKAFSGLQPALQ